MTERLRAIPPLLWVVIGALALAAVTMIGPIVSGLSSTSGGVGFLLVALPWLLVMAVPVVYVRVAWALVEGSRTARAFVVPLAAVFLLIALASGLDSGFAIVAALLLAGATVVFAAPSTRAFFDGSLSHSGPRPPTIAVVRTALLVSSALASIAAGLAVTVGLVLLAVSAAAAGGGELGGAIGLLGGTFSGLALLEALVVAAVAGLGFWAASGLDRGSRTARLALTVGVGVEAIPALWVLVVVASVDGGGPYGVAVAAFFALHLVAAVAPWLFPDARRHFAEPPLPAVDDLHRRLVGLGTHIAPAVPVPVGPPAPAAAAPAGHSLAAVPPAPALPTPRPAPPAPTSRHARPDGAAPTSVPFRETTPSGRHARPESAAAMTCASCGAASQPGWSHCPHCGARTSGRPTPEPRP